MEVGWGEEYTWEPNCNAQWRCFDKDKCCNHRVLYQTIEIAMIDHNDNLGFLFLTAFPNHFRFWTIQSKAKVFLIIPLKKIQIQMERLLITKLVLDISTLDWR